MNTKRFLLFIPIIIILIFIIIQLFHIRSMRGSDGNSNISLLGLTPMCYRSQKTFDDYIEDRSIQLSELEPGKVNGFLMAERYGKNTPEDVIHSYVADFTGEIIDTKISGFAVDTNARYELAYAIEKEVLIESVYVTYYDPDNNDYYLDKRVLETEDGQTWPQQVVYHQYDCSTVVR